MNIETITVGSRTYLPSQGCKEDYYNFGWKHTGDTETRSGRGGHQRRIQHILARDKDMRNYAAIVRLEGEYFSLKQKKKAYTPMEAKNVFIAFVCLIIPGILYVTFKLRQKKRIDEHNAAIQKQMNDIAAKARALL